MDFAHLLSEQTQAQLFAKNLQAKMGDMGVQINHSSAYHPASNGFAERGIKTVKDQLKKHEPNTFI